MHINIYNTKYYTYDIKYGPKNNLNMIYLHVEDIQNKKENIVLKIQPFIFKIKMIINA